MPASGRTRLWRDASGVSGSVAAFAAATSPAFAVCTADEVGVHQGGSSMSKLASWSLSVMAVFAVVIAALFITSSEPSEGMPSRVWIYVLCGGVCLSWVLCLGGPQVAKLTPWAMTLVAGFAVFTLTEYFPISEHADKVVSDGTIYTLCGGVVLCWVLLSLARVIRR